LASSLTLFRTRLESANYTNAYAGSQSAKSRETRSRPNALHKGPLPDRSDTKALPEIVSLNDL